MLGWRRLAATLRTSTVEVNGKQYHIRELTVGERLQFREYAAENAQEQLLLAAWLVRQCCREFQRSWILQWWPVDIVKLTQGAGMFFLADLSREILALSGMVVESKPGDDGEAEPQADEPVTPGTVAAAKKT